MVTPADARRRGPVFHWLPCWLGYRPVNRLPCEGRVHGPFAIIVSARSPSAARASTVGVVGRPYP